jgi:hypothetical protein
LLRNWIEFFSPEDVERIHRASMSVLANCQELLGELQDPPLEAVTARQLEAFLQEKGA